MKDTVVTINTQCQEKEDTIGNLRYGSFCYSGSFLYRKLRVLQLARGRLITDEKFDCLVEKVDTGELIIVDANTIVKFVDRITITPE